MDEMYTLGNWPQGAHELFVELGVLKEIEPSSLVWLWECEDPDWVEPIWLPDAVNGGRVMGFYQCGHEWCGVHVVEPDRRRQWAPSVERIVGLVAELLGCEAPPLVDVPGRVWRLGRVERRKEARDVYLVRGASWRDARTMLDTAARLAGSQQPVVLCLGAVPPSEQRGASWRAVLTLDELAVIKDGSVMMEVSRITDNPSACSGTVPVAEEALLTQAEVDVLEALAGSPTEPQLVVQLSAISGYGRDTVMKAIRRLSAVGLVARPANSARKGVVITKPGLERVGTGMGRLPKLG